MLNPAPAWTAEPETGKEKRKFSAAALMRMRVAQQRRWAKVRGQSAPAANAARKTKRKRKLSAAVRKAISGAAKKRWGVVGGEEVRIEEGAPP